MKTKIEIYSDKFFEINKKTLKRLIYQMLGRLDRNFNWIEVTFLKDEQLLEINKKYLKHNTLTDIITFNYNSDEIISAEILISYERAIENSKKYKCSIEDEILRLIAHGILHSIGYKDKTKSQKIKMSKAENDLLNSINKLEFIKKFEMEKLH